MATHPACDFLEAGFEDDDVIAIAFRRLPSPGWYHRFVTARAARGDRFQAWLRYLNAHGHDLYVSMNTFTPGVRSRTEANVVAIRHIYVEFDHGGDDALAAVRARTDVPEPSCVVHSSPGKFQVIWRVEGFTPARAKPLLRHLAYGLAADTAVHDLNRVLRIPGFRNHKYQPPAAVWLEPGSGRARYQPTAFPEASADTTGAQYPRPERPPRTDGTLSQSERDWAAICRALSRGVPWRDCVNHLAVARSDKSNPRAYALLTVLKALRAVNLPEPSELPAELRDAKLRNPPAS